ncbi:MAG: hypothetical protein ABGX83_07545 [Nitrospira sp.]
MVARRLSATVRFFEYDIKSAGCTEALKQRYFPRYPDRIVEVGSILDADYVRSLGKFDILFILGVIFTTPAQCGKLWRMWTFP